MERLMPKFDSIIKYKEYLSLIDIPDRQKVQLLLYDGSDLAIFYMAEFIYEASLIDMESEICQKSFLYPIIKKLVKGNKKENWVGWMLNAVILNNRNSITEKDIQGFIENKSLFFVNKSNKSEKKRIKKNNSNIYYNFKFEFPYKDLLPLDNYESIQELLNRIKYDSTANIKSINKYVINRCQYPELIKLFCERISIILKERKKISQIVESKLEDFEVIAQNVYNYAKSSMIDELINELDSIKDNSFQILSLVCKKGFFVTDGFNFFVNQYLKGLIYKDYGVNINCPNEIKDYYLAYNEFTSRNMQENKDNVNNRSDNKSSFIIMQSKEFYLDWRWCQFHSGWFTVFCPSDSKVKFVPLDKHVQYCLSSFNYIKDYLNERLPNIKCVAEKGRLTILSPISFDNAILKIAYEKGREQKINMEIDEDAKTLSSWIVTPVRTVFQTSISKNVSEKELRELKSPYINHLITLQEKDYKIIPCVEALTHRSNEKLEPAFMFTVKYERTLFIVFENINLARSTYLFKIKNAEMYMQAARAIHGFMQGPEINKRSYLRAGYVKMHSSGIVGFDCIDHDETYKWKRLLASKARCMYP